MFQRMLLGALVVLTACTDAALQATAKVKTNVDDRLSIPGRVCTAPADPTGFPVKVVLIVDQSGSMCVSDPPGSQETGGFCEMYAVVPPGITQPARVGALNKLIAQFQAQPNVQVALVPFETNIKGVWPPAAGSAPRFKKPDATLLTQVRTLQANLGKGTDYQGALSYAYGLVADDIQQTTRTSPALLPRTRYVVVFLTDGTPFPRCSANDNLTQYADADNPDLTWEDSIGAGGSAPDSFCNAMIDPNMMPPPDPNSIITGFTGGTDRNQNYQLFSYVDQLMELKKQFNVGDIRLHTVLLFNEEAVRACGTICEDLYGQYPNTPAAQYPQAAKKIARWLLTRMAERGNGVYQEFNDFSGLGQLSLGALDYSSLSSRNVMKAIYVQALSSEPGAVDREVDSDGDGLPDSLDNDFTAKTNPFFADSDGDGFDDQFEYLRRDDGFRADSKDGRGCVPTSPLTPGCIPRDTDGDGLSQYAERYLGLSNVDTGAETFVDTDGDGVTDGMEVRYGLDPKKPLGAGLDTDADGTPDLEEYRIGSNPIRKDIEFQNKNAYQYEFTPELQPNGSTCYDFTVSNLQLVTPPNRAGLRQGFNLFKVWFDEAPESGVGTDYGTWKTACVWAQYDPPTIRAPAGPQSPTLSDNNFGNPKDMIDSTQYESRCVGISPSRGQTGPTP